MVRGLHRILLIVGLVAVVSLAVSPAPAEAQWHGRFYVSFGGWWPYPYPYWGGPHWGPYWGPYPHFGFGYPWGGPYPYAPYAPYGPWPYYWDPSGAARIQVTPRDAKVFVDGYAAGVVDDFDGTFQRLRASPGGHEVTIYLDGYRTVRQSVYFRPESTQNIRFTMEKLAPGEASDPPPAPQPQPDRSDVRDPDRPPARPPMRSDPQAPPPEQYQARYGTLTIAVQPIDAEIYIDGERWTERATPAPGSAVQRLTLRLTEGRHRVEIRKEGFATYTESVTIGRDRTLTLNVSLARN
jgi:hypothetical protein